MKFIILKEIIRIAILCAFVLPCNQLEAQVSRTYSLSELTDSAKSHLPVLLQKKALVNSAKAGVTDARNSFLPKFTIGDEVSIGSANDVEGGFLPLAGIIHPISGSIESSNNYSAQLGSLASAYAEYDLVNFGLRGAKINNAKAYADLQQADFDKEFYVIKMQIGKLYFDILKNNALLDIDRQNISRYQTVYTIIKALTGSGIKAGVDSSLAIAELSKTKVAFNQRNGIAGQLQQQMSFLTGIPAAQLNIDTGNRSKLIELNGIYGATADSLQNPLLSYYSRQRNLYESNETLVKKSYLPKIVIGAGGWGRGSSIVYNDSYQSLKTGLNMQRFDYISGIGITYDLFNIVHLHDKLAVSHYQSQAAEYGLQQQKDVLNNAVAQADVTIATDEKNLTELPLQLQAANNAYQQKIAQYKAGVINLIDLLNASFVLYSAQQNYVETQNDWYNANLDKAASTGKLDLFIQTIKN
jgi:outer membrane protein TolC